ncbi:MarR family transcriptional regulator [Streptomyces sp. S.PNR 29]|uniref:MarR family winged helix-turn-helix transcriptional regulator n=1 Tax=Streptomyces sp. S.PNR 29 TaxID=2973805 RepID=UPI0025B2233A|nr:MarR family transcriptional regulator [Streptomyces sp. S.PNR 29]MDN0198173.1 MarR family transcriptional regulator [Streptomyces sp. S.PNR 29]
MTVVDLKLVFHDLVQLEIELWNAVDARLRAECDLQLTWFEVMQLLARRSACRIQDVAEEFGITVGGTSKVVDRIEAAGYCRRRANPNDRRSSLIELTPEGRRLVDRAMEVFEAELVTRIGSVLPEQDLETFAATLSALRAAGRAVSARQESA